MGSRKRVLRVMTKVMLLLGIGVAAYPFIASLSVSERSEAENLVAFQAHELQTGVVHQYTIKGKLLYVLKPNELQRQSIRSLDAHVWNSHIRSYKPKQDLYVYWAHSTSWGCPLQHKEPHASVLMQTSSTAEWLGGYWDVACEVSYDYAGRAIKTRAYTFNGYTDQHENLKTPDVFYAENGNFYVSVQSR